MVPEGWIETVFTDACELVNGRGFKPHEWTDVGLPIIRIQNLNGSDEYNHYDGEFNPKILVKHGELLFAWSGSRGTSFGPHIWTGSDAVLNYHTWRLVPKAGTDKKFLLHMLRQITARIEATAHGASALVHTQKGEMEKRRIPLPPLPEQKKIAEILGTWDQAIEVASKQLKNAQNQKRALMQHLLTGTHRLKGFEGSEWKTVKLGDVLEKVIDYRGKAPPKSETGVPLITARNVRKGYLSFDHKEYIDAEQYSTWMNRGLPRENDILFTTEAPLGNTALYPKNADYALGQRIVTLRVDTLNSPIFLFQFLQSHLGQSLVGKRSSGSTAIGIKSRELVKIELELPSLSEQEQIAGVLDTCDSEASGLTQKLHHLRTEKRALMQQLLTGKTRVKVEEAA